MNDDEDVDVTTSVTSMNESTATPSCSSVVAMKDFSTVVPRRLTMKSLAPHTTAILDANIIILNTGVMVE
jgi:hypothetical protein